jgi:hypothetical protein
MEDKLINYYKNKLEVWWDSYLKSVQDQKEVLAIKEEIKVSTDKFKAQISQQSARAINQIGKYRDLEGSLVCGLSLYKYLVKVNGEYFYNKELVSSKKREVFKSSVLEQFSYLTDTGYTIGFAIMFYTLDTVRYALEILKDQNIKARSEWLEIKYNDFAMQVIDKVYDDTYEVEYLKANSDASINLTLWHLVNNEALKNNTFCEAIAFIASGADMNYQHEIKNNKINSLESIKSFINKINFF